MEFNVVHKVFYGGFTLVCYGFIGFEHEILHLAVYLKEIGFQQCNTFQGILVAFDHLIGRSADSGLVQEYYAYDSHQQDAGKGRCGVQHHFCAQR
jgi:hypothetical protein